MERFLVDLDGRMKKTVEAANHNFASVRTGRATAGLLDRVLVDYYGTSCPLKQLATISTPEPKMLLIHPFDKNSIPDIEKAILKSDLGITPANDGQNVRLVFPPLSEERRRELVKVVKNMTEEGKVALRNIRREAVDELKKQEKAKMISEDDSKRKTEEVQKLVDKYSKEIDEHLKKKETDILEV